MLGKRRSQVWQRDQLAELLASIVGPGIQYAMGAAPRLLVVLASLASSSTTAPACDGDGPTVAICVAGNARTFREAAVHGSYKPNLADAFGGKRTVLFAFLKATDRGWKGASREENLGRGSLVDATVAGELERIVGGMGLEVGALEVIDGLHTEPEPHCQRKYFMTHHPDPNASDAWRAREVLQSGLGQVANANWCGSQIEAFEEAHGMTFDVIFKNRPDGYFPEPISPFCAWDLSKFCAARDWFWMLPRASGVAALRRGYEDAQTCFKDMTFTKNMILESWNSKGLGKALSRDATTPVDAPRADNFRVRVMRATADGQKVYGNSDAAMDARCGRVAGW